MKSGVPLITIILVSLGLIIWVVVFKLGGIPGLTSYSAPPVAAVPEPTPEPPKPPQPKPVKKVVAEVVQPAPAPPEPAPVVAPPPPPPELPAPDLSDVSLGSSRRDLLMDFHKPALQATATVRGQLYETYVYSPDRAGRDMFVHLHDGRVAAKFDVAHDQ